MGFNVQDASLIAAAAIPTGNTPTKTPAIDLGAGPEHTEPFELLLSAPALVVGSLPNGSTVTYKIEACASAAFGSGVVVIADGLAVQTGAGGTGAPATTARVRVPSNSPRYIRGSAVGAGTTSPSVSETFSLSLRF